jgi:hypothetical protein
MMNFEALFSAVSVPTWLAVVGAFAAILLLLMLFRPNAERDPLMLFGLFALVAVVGAAAFFGLNHLEQAARLADRRGLEERALALNLQTALPAVACADVGADKPLGQACERAQFAEPQRVAAGLALARERLALVSDALDYSARDSGFGDRLSATRRALEADPYGFVAFVLASENNCTADSCARFRLMRDSNRVKANLRERRYESLVAKYEDGWREPKPVVRIETPAPAPVPAAVPQTEAPYPPPAPVVTAPTPPPPAPTATAPAPTPRAGQPKQKLKDGTSNVRPRVPPEPVAGLPRVVPRRPAADDDGDAPPPPQTSGVRPAAPVGARQN